jgi:Protein of unknown function (DUF3179)
MKPAIGRLLLTAPLIVGGLFILCLGAAFALTDPAPATLPRRTMRLIADISALLSPPPKPAPSPPIVDARVVPAPAAGLDVRDGYFVVGVEVKGESRAYPLNMLSRPDHHVIDDILGGQPIAVTWCGLCQSPLVYERQVDGKALTLFVSGELYGENMVMKDLETGSEWPQMMGEAIKGPLTGKSLAQIPSVWTDWKTWRTQHPKTTVLKIVQTIDYYQHNPESSTSPLEERYFSNLQWGFVRGGNAISWPLSELAPKSAINDAFGGLPLLILFDSRTATIAAFERRVDDSELTFHWGAGGLIDDQTSSVWDPLTGRGIGGKLIDRRLTPVTGVVSHQRAWRTQYPRTVVRTLHAI